MGRIGDLERRRRFALWLQEQFREQELWIRHGDHYQAQEFLRKHGLSVSSSTIGHYLRGRRLPSPEVCAELAEATRTPFLEVMAHAGYHDMDDLDAYVRYRNRLAVETAGELEVA